MSQLGKHNFKDIKLICVLMWAVYRSWVPDEDLGAAVGELFTCDFEVGHQHLNSFPVWGKRGKKEVV